MNVKGVIPPSVSFGGSGLSRRMLTIPGVALVLVLATLFVFVPLQIAPELAIGFALLLILIVPGFLLAKILFPDNPFPALTDIPVSLVFSIAIWSIPAAILRLVRLDWAWFNAIFVITLWALGLVYCVRLWRTKIPVPFTLSGSLVAIEGTVIMLGLGAAWISAHAGRSSDDWGYLIVIQLLRTHESFGLDNFQNARDALRFAIQTPLFLEALALRLVHYDPVTLVRELLPPAFVPVAFVALYAWAKEFTGKAWVGLAAVVFQFGVFVLVGEQSASWSLWFFGRIGQDKFMTWLLLMPIALLFFWRFMRGGQKASLSAYGIALIAIVMVHPIGLAVVCLAIGGFALFNLIQPTRLPLRRWLLATGWILPVGLVALLFRLLTPDNYFVLTATTDPAVASYLSLSEQRLILLPPDLYLAHPGLIRNPLILVAIGLVPLLAGRLRSDLHAQFLWGSMLVPLAFLFTPAGAWILGQLVMPWELWRLTWVLPVGLTLGYFLMWFTEFRTAPKPNHRKFALGWLAVVMVAAWYVGPLDFNASLNLWARSTDVSPQAKDLLRSLPQYVTRPSLVLAPLEWQQMMPAYALDAQPAASISLANAKLYDANIESFYQSTLYTDKIVQLIAAPGISFIVLPNSSYLNEQLMVQHAFFARLYQNQEYSLYKVIQKPKRSLTSVGLLRLEQARWRLAKKKLQRAASEVDDNALAFFGLGYAYRELNAPKEAEAAFRQALILAPNLRIAHLKLGELFRTEGRTDEAAREFDLAK